MGKGGEWSRRREAKAECYALGRLIRKHRQDSSWAKEEEREGQRRKRPANSCCALRVRKEKEKKVSYLSAGDEEDGSSDVRDFCPAVPLHSQEQRLRHGEVGENAVDHGGDGAEGVLHDDGADGSVVHVLRREVDGHAAAQTATEQHQTRRVDVCAVAKPLEGCFAVQVQTSLGGDALTLAVSVERKEKEEPTEPR